MIVRTYGATHFGPEGVVVEVEASIQSALPSILITGLPGDVVRESGERIRACLYNLGHPVPSSKVLVHLSPATAKKQGSQLDLAIALALMAVEGRLKTHRGLDETGFLGELCLDGRIRGVRGALALAQALLQKPGIQSVVVPQENAAEVGLLRSKNVFAARGIDEVVQWLETGRGMVCVPFAGPVPPTRRESSLDRIQGQRLAKRAIQVALAGRHHLLLVGPPGVGKTLLAQAAAGLLPPLEWEERIALVKHRGYFNAHESERPFRSPHHSISAPGLLGGGTATIASGEVTLAHGGILFLDELPEFRKDALEGLREPLESGMIHLHRVGTHLSLPARFFLIAAMNPCPCGYRLDSQRTCRCTPEQATAYRRKISGPIFDRMDLCVVLEMPKTTLDKPGPGQEGIQQSIVRAHERQRKRYSGRSCFNGEAEVDVREGPFALDTESQSWLDSLCVTERLSFRALHKVLRVSRTIADLEPCDDIRLPHLQEAWGLRCRDFVTGR